MALVLKNGSIFLHIPKTGGNWVTHVLKNQGLVEREISHKHSDLARTVSALSTPRQATLKEFLLRRPVDLRGPGEKPFIFTFVRHPLRWYESWFKYQSQDTRNWKYWGEEGALSKWHPNASLNGLGSTSFSEFVRNVQVKKPGYVTELFFSYATPEVDFIGKQESIRHDLCAALEKAEIDFDANYILHEKKVGVSKPKAANITWDEPLREEVMRNEWPALRRFGYAD